LSRSTFPQQVDTFVELYDLPAGMVTQAKRYQELKAKPTLTSTEQSELNGLTTQLGNYIITPETWNKFGDALVNVEIFFNQQVDGYILQKQQEWATYVDDFSYQGVYSSTKAYKFQNMITFNGDLYLATKDAPAGTQPTNTSYWQKISTKGDKGDTGLNAYYKGAYNSSLAYAVGDAVDFGGFIYYCKLATTAGTSPTDSTHWFLWDKTIVSATQPPSRQEGIVWIKLT
jgi:hypothetical protein